MDNWVRRISKDAIVFNKDRVQINVHILFEKDNDIYNAHCLEFDITTDGNTLDEAEHNIIDCIRNHVEFCVEMGNFDKIYDPAPQEYWNKLLYSRQLNHFPFPEKLLSPEINYPIKEVDTYEVECYA